MTKSKFKLLLNAEPFGFGPTAAIATFFPDLRDKFESLSYLGKNHTLDLQKDLAYDKIHDVSKNSKDEIKNILSQYDILLTALDFEIADLAKSVGLKVIIYDPLTWYWKTIWPAIGTCDLYLAQDFFGVRERIENNPNLFQINSKLVPPIVSQKRPKISRKYILVNLGGLQNPLWSVDEVFQYAKTFIEIIKNVVGDSEQLIIATSNAIVERLNDDGVKTYTRNEMYKVFENTKFAFMTSGLGNIYDAAKFDIPTIWLPPANDSQGQQLKLLEQYNMYDAKIDWSDLGSQINYFGDQPEVLENIKKALYSLGDTEQLKKIIIKSLVEVSQKENSSTSILLDKFGTGGGEKVAEAVYEFSQNIK